MKNVIFRIMKIKEFRDKNVYLFGGSSGIGLATAKLLAGRGASLFLFARNRERLEGALKEVTEQRIGDGQRFSCVSLDVSKHNDVVRKLEKAVKSFGVPDVLINCAGRAIPDNFEKIGYEQFDETMRVNLYGVWNTISTLLPHMKGRGGHIVNVASILGFFGVFGYSDYCAAKYGIIGLSETLRVELKDYGISIQVVIPPDTDTPGFREENKTKPPETESISGVASLAQPEDVAKTIVNGMGKGKFLIISNFMGKVIYLVKRFLPGVIDVVFAMDIKRVRKKLHKEKRAGK